MKDTKNTTRKAVSVDSKVMLERAALIRDELMRLTSALDEYTVERFLTDGTSVSSDGHITHVVIEEVMRVAEKYHGFVLIVDGKLCVLVESTMIVDVEDE